jgi:alkyl hydroperoxide reductase subunit AhpF
MVYLCNSMAYLNPLITTEIIEANDFRDFAARYVIGVTPKIVINEKVEVVDRVPAAELIARIVAAQGAAASPPAGAP